MSRETDILGNNKGMKNWPVCCLYEGKRLVNRQQVSRWVNHGQAAISDQTTGHRCADGPRKGKTETSGGWRGDDSGQRDRQGTKLGLLGRGKSSKCCYSGYVGIWLLRTVLILSTTSFYWTIMIRLVTDTGTKCIISPLCAYIELNE